ncbi:MAG: MIP/aquaporin family protein [Nitrososphaerales archaeon]
MKKTSIPCYNCRKECVSELTGTYLLVLFGPGSVVVASLIPNLSIIESLAFIAFSFSAIVALVIIGLGKYSGANINPAISLAIVSAKLLKKDLLVPYILFQVAGGLLAGFTLKLIFSGLTTSYLGSTTLAIGVTPLYGVIIESLGTFVLASSVLIASTRIKGSKSQALFIGTTLFILILLIGPLTGASFNPARSLGPALGSGYFTNLTVYLVGPVTGALFAGFVFRVIGSGKSC